MPSDQAQADNLSDLLKNDFDGLTARYEQDRFAERVLFKLTAKSRARQGVVFFAGGLGAAFAASQFTGVVDMISVYVAETSPNANVLVGDVSQFVATLLLAGALAATAMVLRQEA